MASVSERGGRWYVKYRDGHGKWVRQVSTADTKTAARRFAAELERRAERQRLGLEQPLPQDGGGTLAGLLVWWLETYSKGRPSHQRNVSAVKKHLLGAPIAALRLSEVTSGRLEEFLQAKAGSYAPQTVNHLRRFVLTAFACARRAGRWAGANPAEAVQRRRIPRRAHDYLSAASVLPLLQALHPRWRPLFAVAIYTGLRKGELLGLRKHDVDLDNGLLTVARSYAHETTKGGHADTIPVASEALPWLAEAMRRSPSELVFPALNGRMMRPDVKLEGVLRRAMGRAGITTGYQHRCRRRGCTHREAAPDAALRRCPVDGRKLWPVPQVRPLRFHDLRHGTASLLLMAGADAVAVQKLMRHGDLKTTIGTYGHLAPGYLRSAVDRLSFLGPSPVAVPRPLSAPLMSSSDAGVEQLGPTLVQEAAAERGGPEAADSFPEQPWAVGGARDTGFEPVAFGSGERMGTPARVVTAC